MRIIAFLCFLMMPLLVFPQKQKKKQVVLNYIQKPLIKVDNSWKYNVKVSQTNREELAEKREAYTAKIAKAEADYQKALETYNNLSSAERLLTKEPKKRAINKYFIGKELEEEEQLRYFEGLAGFSSSETANFTIEIIFDGFKYITADKKNSAKDGSGDTYYSVEFKNKVNLKVIDQAGNILLDQVVDDKLKRFKTKSGSDAGEVEKSWKANKVSIISKIEEESYKEQMMKANQMVNDQLGYPSKSLDINIFSAKAKKITYPDLDEALENTEKAMLTYNDENQQSVEALKTALQTWNERLANKDISDKKAEVNKIIASALYINAAYSYALVNDFEKANECLVELKVLKPARFTTDIRDLEAFVKDFSKRNSN